MSEPLLHARGLVKEYALRRGLFDGLFGEGRGLRAVDAVDIAIARGEVLALVGESGSGKTTTGKLAMLQERPTQGSIFFEGADVTDLKGAALKAYRRRVQMIFQNPFESLDPRRTVLSEVAEPLAIHGVGDAAERRARAEAALAAVELTVSRFAQRYPADLSGGQLQRVAIARALVLEPSLIVADEPVSMLDVSVRSGVMNLMLDLRERLGAAYLYITHDLAVARYMSTRIAVMYLGAIVEEGPTETLISRSAHPYTRLLVAAAPEHAAGRQRRRIKLKGELNIADAQRAGCRFHPRCPLADAQCQTVAPPKVAVAPGHWAACHKTEATLAGAVLAAAEAA